MSPARRIVLVAYPGVQSLDVAGPVEVFETATTLLGTDRDGYRTEVVGPTAGVLSTSSGLELGAPKRAADVRGPLDTLVVAGGPGARDAAANRELVADVGRLARRSRRVASVCTGAFVLAAGGLLDGRRATTHWSACDELAARFPNVRVDPDPIFVRDGSVWTSAGVTAGMDLALALVEDDHGRELALKTARWLVLYLKRPGGQAQFSAHLASQLAEREPLRDVQTWIAERPAEDLSVPALARRAGMSTRNFARAFRREVGTTPAAYVEQARLEAARRLLETTGRTVDDVARACGFGTVETLHRAFRRSLRVTPLEYRRRFLTAVTT